MVKNLIIVGAQGSGKTTKARKIAEQYNLQTVWVEQTNFENPFAFSLCEKDTQLIICEEIENIDTIFRWYLAAENGIVVNKENQKPFLITPKIILISQSIKEADLLALGHKFSTLFDIVKC